MSSAMTPLIFCIIYGSIFTTLIIYLWRTDVKSKIYCILDFLALWLLCTGIMETVGVSRGTLKLFKTRTRLTCQTFDTFKKNTVGKCDMF